MLAFLHALIASRNTRIIAAILGVVPVLLLAQPAVAASPSVPSRSSERDTITIEGTTFSPLTRDPNLAPIPGTKVEFIDALTNKPIAKTISEAGGVYTIELPFDGKPIHAYMRGSIDGYLTTLVFPPQPLTHDIGDCPPFVHTDDCMNVALLTAAQANFVAGLGAVQRVPAKGEVLFLAAGCDGTPVAGATIEIAPKPETVVYTNGPFPNPGAEATDSSGRAFGFNLKPGKATIVARYPDGSTGVSRVRIEAGAITIASTFPQRAHCSA